MSEKKRKNNQGVGCLVLIVLAFVIYAVSNKPPASSRGSDPVSRMESGLHDVPNNRDVRTVRYANGEYTITMVVRDNEDWEEAVLDVFTVAGTVIVAWQIDANNVAIVTGNEDDEPTGIVIASADDLRDLQNGEITRRELTRRWETP